MLPRPLLYSFPLKTCPHLPLFPPVRELPFPPCPALEGDVSSCLGATSVKQQGSNGQLPHAVVWFHVPNVKAVASAWTAKLLPINSGGAYGGATAA